MNIPDKTNPAWRRLVTEDFNYNFKYLGFKVLLMMAVRKYKNKPTNKTLDACIDLLRDFFEKTKHLPLPAEDLNKIFFTEVK